MKHDQNQKIDILIVEDSPTQAEQLCYLLEQQHYKTRIAANGRLGLEAIRQQRPTIVISDIVMPEMDGYALCRAIKSDADLKDIPVVMVTSLSGIQDIARSLECGADNFICKPYEPKALLSRIEYILLNLELRKSKRVTLGFEVYLGGTKHYITSEREQIIDLLISTYEEAVRMNEELQIQQVRIARTNQTLSGLYRIADELNRVTTQAMVCELALQATMEMPKFEAGCIYLSDDNNGYRLAATYNPDAMPEIEASFNGRHCPVWTEDAEFSVVTDHHAYIPLALERRHLGVINLKAAAGENFTEDDLKLLDTIGNQVAVALERARLHEHLESLVEQRTAALRAEIVERCRAEEKVVSLNRIYAVLSGINTLIVRVHDRGELFHEACSIAVDLGHFNLAWIGFLDQDSHHINPLAWSGEESRLRGDTLEMLDFDLLYSGIVEEARQRRQPIICRDQGASSESPVASDNLLRGYRALCVLPLLAEGVPVALLFLYSEVPDLFDDREMHLLEELAGDISFAMDHISKEERINYLAYYDALTGLPNRDLLLDRLHQGISLAKRHERLVAVIYIDLDRFKLINDGLGHHVGDQLLQMVGNLLNGTARVGDTVGRVAADKFIVVCCDLVNADELTPAIEKIRLALQAPIRIVGETFHLTASIGISLSPADHDDPAILIKYAELAMYQAKEQGSRQHVFFTADLDTKVSERLRMQNRLGMALEAGELVVYYQPQVNAMTGVVCGMEALIRWQHPEFGLIPPGQFISIAEESGLIIPIGEWVLKESCRQNQLWHEEGISDFAIAVNLSAAQFRDKGLLACVRNTLEETGLDPHFLELELTESMVMDNSEQLIAVLDDARALGVQISIDDFGTGYSSLNYLRRLPVDRLKIDYCFVRDITSDPASASICRAIISIAHNLRMGVVAEGVETEAQASYLARHYCESLQGFFFSKAVPADEVTALLRRREPLIMLAPDLNARRTLLVVDDEEHIQNSLRRLLRGDGYQILTASDSMEAFELLAKHEVGVILADQRMPEMSGTEFLSRVKDMYPTSIRIVLSGYTDLETVTASVNQGSVYKFLVKPWDNDALREALRDAFWRYELSKGISSNWCAGSRNGMVEQ